MRRLLGLFLAASTIAIGLAACDDDSGLYGYPSRYGGDYCRVYTSCDTCTPVAGCGWCFIGNKGACVAHPDECAGVSAFSWTWDPTGCHVGADASTGPVSSTDARAPEASAPADDASPPSAEDASPVEADSSAD
jgi:hypothetical protein